MAASDTKIFKVDKFLGLNESCDSATELKMGEASKIENFCITDGYNLRSRPGIRRYGSSYLTWNAGDLLWKGYVEGREYLLWGNGGMLNGRASGLNWGEQIAFPGNVKIRNILQSGKDVYVLLEDLDTGEICTPKLVAEFDESLGRPILDVRLRAQYGGGYFEEPYIPLAVSGCTPAGGGTTMEPLNILTDKFRVQFTSESGVTDYVLPEMAADVVGVHVAGVEYPAEKFGTYDAETHTFAGNACAPGVEVVFVCVADDADLKAAREKFLAMPYHEHFNGATDTRIFFYGDGSNVCYYSGVLAFSDRHGYGDRHFAEGSTAWEGTRDGTHNEASLYIPAGNEIAVDFSDSPITAMVRHYSRLLVFKPDGTDAIIYEPVTLADGSVIAGFYLRPVHREFGNDALGQVVLINNNPRSFSKGSIYEWRIASGYRDERNAKCISQKVTRTVAAADPAKLVVCDDGPGKTYYVFLNDEAGTVLVNRYDLDAWSIYTSELTKGVTKSIVFEGYVLFTTNGGVYRFDPESRYDDAVERDGEDVPIEAVWESGYMDFGADHRRKYSSRIWLSLLPEVGASLDVTVETDKRSDYLTKTAGYALLGFGNIDFSDFSFLTHQTPKIKRIQIKVKKFVYYKLILKVTKPGARATVLGYDQQVRFSSNVK